MCCQRWKYQPWNQAGKYRFATGCWLLGVLWSWTCQKKKTPPQVYWDHQEVWVSLLALSPPDLCSKASVQFSRSVVSDSATPWIAAPRPPCPSPTPRVHSNSSPSSRWCHPAISSSVIPFSFCPQSLPASGSFPMSQLFAWGGQSTGVSALASFFPKNTQDWHSC